MYLCLTTTIDRERSVLLIAIIFGKKIFIVSKQKNRQKIQVLAI